MDAPETRGGIAMVEDIELLASHGEQLPCPGPVDPDPWRRYKLSATLSAFCVTVYNEKRSAVEATVRSIATAVSYCRREDASFHGPSVLCLIADGKAALDPELLTWLQNMRLLNAAPLRLVNTELHFPTHGSVFPALQLAPDTVTSGAFTTGLHSIVCIKNSNLGKLHSHALFFGTVCQHVQPEFCFQVDAGTTLAHDAVIKLIHRLRERPELAALAPRVMPPIPAAEAGFLAHWQYADFAARKGILWPFELATGHLGVIPGQTCVFRWEALRRAHSADPETGKADPLSSYLCGADTLGCLGRIMYLAEDRVIGNQIMLAHGSRWKLGYAPDASAETDSCTRWAELLRQRRRWNNSEMATRWWLLRQLPNTLRRRDRTTAQNRRFVLAVCTQAVLAAREFLVPAQVIAILIVMLPWSWGPPASAHAMLTTAWLIAVGAWFLLEFLVAVPLVHRAARTGRLRRILHWTSTGLFVATTLLTMPFPCCLILLAPALYLPNMSLVLPRSGLISAMQTRVFYLPHLATAAVLSCYSFWNLHDASWGTKGLKATVASDRCRSQLRRWRNLIFSVWLAANGVVTAAALRLHGLLSPQLNPVVEIFAVADLLLAIVSLCYLTGWLSPTLPTSGKPSRD